MFDRHYLLKSDSKLRNKNFMYANFLKAYFYCIFDLN